MTCRRISRVFLGVVIATMVPVLANAIGVEFTPVVGHFTALESQITDNDAPLVVRQSDGLPGQGWWVEGAKKHGFTGLWEGPKARRLINKLQRQAFDYWSSRG